jgi:hypothetical protein
MRRPQTLYPGRLRGLPGAVNRQLGYGALGVPMLNSVYPESGNSIGGPPTDTYLYNAQKTAFDYLGNIFLLPKHTLIPDGCSVFQNLFAVDGVDWTDVSNWTEGTGVTVSQENATTLRAVGVGSSVSGNALRLDIMSGVDVAGRVAGAVAYIWTDDPTEVGNTAVFRIKRSAGGTDTPTDVTATLSLTPQPIYTGEFTGLASNTGLTLAFANSGSADDFLIQYPGIIEWRTGQDTSKPPMPGDIKCFVPVGANIPSSFSAGSTDPDTGFYDGLSFSGVSASGVAHVVSNTFTIVEGQTYVAGFDATVNAGSFSGTKIKTGSNTALTSAYGLNETPASGFNSFSFTATGSSSTARIGFRIDDAALNFDVSSFFLRESANGLYCSEYTPNNSVSSGVITAGTGTLLHPWHWERIGYSVPVKRLDVYDPFTTYASSAVTVGTRFIPTTRNGYYYEVTVAGTTGTDNSSGWSTTIGATFSSGTATIKVAGYYTNEGASIEPAATQDMATAAVLATGGSASTYPTSWAEEDSAGILSVVGEGVSPIHPDARYVDVRINNTTGSNQAANIVTDTTSISGISQGDDVTMSAWVSLVSGTQAGNTRFSLQERDASDAFLANTVGTVFSLSADMEREADTIAAASASADKYRPTLRFTGIPDGTDFTIRITLPNSVQQSFVSSVILGQETRTSQVGALKYSIANFNVANTQARCDVSMGVAQSAIAAISNIWSVDASSATTGVHFQSDGDLAISDGTNTAVVTDWSETSGTVFRTAANLITSSDDLDLDVYTPTATPTGADESYADAMGTPDFVTIGATTLSYPTRIHNIAFVPNGGETAVTLASDSERYT